MTISCPRCKKPLVPPSGAPQAACPHCGQLIQLAVAAPVPFPFPSEPSVAVRSSGSASRRPSAADKLVPFLVPVVLLNLVLTIWCAIALGIWEYRIYKLQEGLRDVGETFQRDVKKAQEQNRRDMQKAERDSAAEQRKIEAETAREVQKVEADMKRNMEQLKRNLGNE